MPEKDLIQVQRLVEDLYRAYPTEEGSVPDIALTFAEFERFPEKGRIVVFESSEGDVFGYAILVFFRSNEFGCDVIDVDELLVDEQHRNLGTGKKFFQWLESSYPKCVGFSLQTTESNISAAKLYKNIGFQRSGRNHMFKSLAKRVSSH